MSIFHMQNYVVITKDVKGDMDGFIRTDECIYLTSDFCYSSE